MKKLLALMIFCAAFAFTSCDDPADELFDHKIENFSIDSDQDGRSNDGDQDDRSNDGDQDDRS